MFVYIFEPLQILKNDKKYNPFITHVKKPYYIMMEYKKYEFKGKENIIKYTEYKSNLISIQHNVSILNIDDGINVVFNEKDIGIIESFYQLSSNNIENIFKTLIKYKKGNIIFLLE